MEWLSDTAGVIGGIVSTVVLPLLGFFFAKDYRKRKAAAEARKAEAENITMYASEWKELYEKKEKRVNELEAKAEEDRKRIRELQEKNTELKLENLTLKFMQCKVDECDRRQPPRVVK